MNKKIKALTILSAFVLSVATVLSTYPCIWIWHQPKIPEGIKKLRKS